MGEKSMSDTSKRDGGEGREYAAGPTIVGGRPLANGRAQQSVPRGIEVLVKKASVDLAFREVLLARRAAAAAEIGLELSPAEIATLNSVPRSQIEQIIRNTTVPNEQRRVFLGKIAALMVAMLGVGAAGCSTEEPSPQYHHFGGIRPEFEKGYPRMLPNSERVRPENEQLKPVVEDLGTNTVTVKVNYNCPFEYGELSLVFGSHLDAPEGMVTCNPALAILRKGKGEKIFSAEGKEGTSRWLIVRLINANEQGRMLYKATRAYFKRALLGFQPGEYQVGNWAIYKVVEFHKVWLS
jgi:hypothetical protein